MKGNYIIVADKPSLMLEKMINSIMSAGNFEVITNSNNLPDLRNKKIVFTAELDKSGFSINLSKIINELYDKGLDSLYGSTGAALIHSNGELFTKTAAQNIIFHANSLGCRFPGRPIVEATGSLNNLRTLQKITNKSLEDTCIEACYNLGDRLIKYSPQQTYKKPKLLVLHSSNRNTSNTMRLWDMVKKHLKDIDINEIHIANGTIHDCIGCPYKTCKHYGEQSSCFYGGFIVEEIYPAILDADILLWICPNYNDALSANLTAVINRLTALFRKTKFYDKTMYSIIVSGHSGSDALAKQLISALNINKTFRLPPYFALMATANDKDAILSVPNIEDRAKKFAHNIMEEML